MPLNVRKPTTLEDRLEQALDRLERMILPEAVYTAEEVAQLLKTTKIQIYGLIRVGKLQAFHLERNGSKWLVTGRAINDLISTLERESA